MPLFSSPCQADSLGLRCVWLFDVDQAMHYSIVSCVICFSIQINGNLASSYSFTLTFNHLVIHLESFVFREDLAGSVFSLSKTYFNVTPFSNKTIEKVPLFCL